MNAAIMNNEYLNSEKYFAMSNKNIKNSKKLNVKTKQNEEYLAMIDRGIKQIKEGKGILVTDDELELMLNE